MSKHTPGPWEVYHDKYYDVWSVEGGGDVVADLWRLDEETHNRHPHFEDDCEANARLISALPDLLEACERAEKLISAILSFYGQGLEVINWHLNGEPELLDNFIDDNSDGTELESIRAAIAKAKGPQ